MSDAPDDLEVIFCHHCDFSTGMRGMDRCARCDGTGTGFWVKGRFYPNTEDGYLAACEAAGITPVPSGNASIHGSSK